LVYFIELIKKASQRRKQSSSRIGQSTHYEQTDITAWKTPVVAVLDHDIVQSGRGTNQYMHSIAMPVCKIG
jgi:hypothetical protein